jgi:hypothetical protein
MSTTEVVKVNGSAVAPQTGISPETMELVMGKGDLSALTPGQRVEYIGAVCRSLGMNPLTRPFDIQALGGKTVLYARKDAADQLRQIHGVSTQVISREKLDDLIVVTVRATDRTGRSDESLGAVPCLNIKGEALANAMMKAETKAKRRVTLSLCGLGVIDETELESVNEALAVKIAPAEKPWKTKAEMIQVMENQMRRIGSEAYYRVLAAEGMEEATQIVIPAMALRIYSTLLLIQSIETAQAEASGE